MELASVPLLGCAECVAFMDEDDNATFLAGRKVHACRLNQITKYDRNVDGLYGLRVRFFLYDVPDVVARNIRNIFHRENKTETVLRTPLRSAVDCHLLGNIILTSGQIKDVADFVIGFRFRLFWISEKTHCNKFLTD